MRHRRTFLKATLGGALSFAALPPAGRRLFERRLGDMGQAPRALRILILGGTGLTGPHQISYALGRGHQITVFNRGRRNDRLPPGVVQLQGDRNLHQVNALKGKDWDVVIDNPVTLPFWVKDAAEVLKGHTRQYVFISTISVYNPAGQTTITENSPLSEYQGGDPLAVDVEKFRQNPGELYGPMKTASEREALKWYGDATTIIRPGLIVGPGDTSFRFGYWPHRINRGGEILAPGDGSDPIQIIDARDIAEWTVRMVETGSTGTYNATGPRAPLTMAGQLYGIRAAISGDRDLRFTWVPADFLAARSVAPWSEMPTWLPPDSPDSVIARTNITRAVDKGLTFRPLATTVADGMAWFDGLPEATRTQVARNAGIAPDKEAGVLAAWHQDPRSKQS